MSTEENKALTRHLPFNALTYRLKAHFARQKAKKPRTPKQNTSKHVPSQL